MRDRIGRVLDEVIGCRDALARRLTPVERPGEQHYVTGNDIMPFL